MNNEFSDGITVTDVCAKLFLNRTYFSVLFRKYMNVSPGEYLLNLRFNEACKLLKQTSLSVQAVAEGRGHGAQRFFQAVQVADEYDARRLPKRKDGRGANSFARKKLTPSPASAP